MSRPAWYAEMEVAEAAHLKADKTNLFIQVWELSEKDDAKEYAAAFALLEGEEETAPNKDVHVGVLVRRAKLCNELAGQARASDDKDKAAEWTRLGFATATRAVEVKEDSFGAHLW
jgi:hypothetical protein